MLRKRKKQQRQKDITISGRFFRYTSLILTCLMLFFCVLTYFYVAGSEEKESTQNMEVVTGQVSASLENTIRFMDRILVSYAADTTMQNLLVTQDEDFSLVEKAERMNQANQFLETLCKVNEDIYNIEYVLDNGEHYSAYNRYVYGGQIGEAARELYQKGDWYGFRILSARYSFFQSGMESHTISLVRLLHADNSPDPIGYGVISFKQTSLENSLYQLIQKSTQSDKTARVLISNENTIFFHSNENTTGEKDLLALVQDLQKNQQLQQSGKSTINGKEILYEYRQNDYDDISTLTYIYADELHSDIYIYLLLIFLVALILEGGILLLWWGVTHRLLHPVTQLCADMKKEFPCYAKEPEHIERQPTEIGVLYKTYNEMVKQIVAWHEKAIRYQGNINQLEKTTLSMQVNPHYFYNVLSLISARAETGGDPIISQICTDLAYTMRYAIKAADMVPLRDEKKMVEKYLRILSLMYDKRFVANWQVPPEYWNWKVPKVILQPLVENAMNHGELVSRDDACLTISVVPIEGATKLIVSDNGCGMEETECRELNRACRQSLQDFVEKEHRSLGVLSVNFRLKYYFGNKCTLHIASSRGNGTTVNAMIPQGIAKEDRDSCAPH